MILECPNCETRYELPVDLPPEGRKVRCASCKHVWTATPSEPPKPEINLEDFQDEEIVFQETEGDEAGSAEAAAQDTSPSGTDEAGSAEAAAQNTSPSGTDEAGNAEAAAQDTPPSGTADEPDEEGLSETDLEDAFAAVFDEAAAPDTGPAGDEEREDKAEEEAREAPPIVIGRAKRRRVSLPGNLAAGWAALALFISGVVALGYYQRVNVVRLLPGAAAAYERIGLAVNVRGLEFEDVKYSWETSAGRPVLEVYGDIVNITSEPLRVPTVVFGLRTKEKVEVYQWAADVRSELLPGGQKTAFAAQIPTPPKSIRDVQVRFAKVR